MEMNVLVGGASAQSRARRPVPPEWEEIGMLSRGPASEVWISSHGLHPMRTTWVFDQGGPVLGYTCESNPLTVEHWAALQHVPFGPGGVVSQWEWNAARLLVGAVGKYAVGGESEARVRFLANGSDALECAARLARAHTDQVLVCSIGYHGSAATFAHEPQCKGTVPIVRAPVCPWGKVPYPLPYSCVVVEVPSDDERAVDYLGELRAYCDRVGALLVLDEVVTGFRLALGGAAELYNVKADLLCYGKAMSNGRPISAVVGRAELLDRLDKDVFYSNTYNGDPHSCAQVCATLRYLCTAPEAKYAKLWGVGESLRQGLAAVGVRVRGHAPRTYLDFTNGDEDAAEANERRLEFCRRMVKRGTVIDQPNYASLAHTQRDVDDTVAMAAEVVEEMKW